MPIAVALFSAVACLLLLDWVMFDTRAVLPRLPTFRNDGSPNDKIFMAARYPDTKVLYLGDSRIRYGIDPSVVSKECNCGPGFNAGFPGAEIRTTRLMGEELLGRLSPNLVVIGVSQWELSDEADVNVGEGVRELAPPWRRGEFEIETNLPKDLPELVAGIWQLYKYRGELRQALDVWVGEGRADDPRRGFTPYEGRSALKDEHLEFREKQWFTNFSVEGRRTQALRGLIAELQRRGLRVVLVVPPLLPEFQQEVRREVATFRTAIAKLANEQGVLLIDVTDPEQIGVDDDLFRDVVHLEAEGAAKLSRHVGRQLRSDKSKNKS